ncbi:response regulator [Alteromonas portus]|uniref:Sensory/regulatory protein RpfC n=1 Tax=Alteromonas portus TaxID=2565549 RepID=A0A4U0ZJ11_9ALTE|nr:PAS domain-containing hybrid sensor histidine kinase/response regulator [Alteromonas portus]TKB04667.1 response regulator [Alteromonas portus]
MNSLLERQLRRAFQLDEAVSLKQWLDSLNEDSVDNTSITHQALKQGLAALISRINESYTFNERDIKLRDRSLHISSEELIAVNRKMREEFDEQKAVGETLRLAVNQLLEDRNKPLIDENFTNLSDLSSLMYELIREQKNATNELLLQRRAMDKHGIVATIDINGNLLSANDKCCQLSGYSREELIGQSTAIFRVDNISSTEQVEILGTLVKGEIWQGELNSLTKDDKPWTVFATIVPIVEYNRQVNRLVVICTDMSEQLRLARRLKEDRTFHESITDSIGEGVYAVNGEGKTQFLNPAASRLLGWTLKELQERRFHDTVHYQKGDGTLLPREQCPVNLTIKSGTSYTSYEDFFTDKRGRLFPISIVAVPLFDKEGKPDGHVGVFNDISSQKAIEHKLQKAYDEAQSANKAKSDFLATMSHEIRTPMNAIIGLTHLALESQDNEQQQQYLEKVQNSANALLELVDSILDFSKVEANKIDIIDEPFTLTRTIEKLAQVFQVKAQQKQLQLLFDIRCSANIPCQGDSEKIYQVLLNLLSNAIKFTERGSVTLIVEQKGSELMFCVSDTGMGITDEGKSKLFNAFVQADASISRKYGGTGLGLAICKRLVALMGGNLTLESKVNEGSRFSFSLPVCRNDKDETKPTLPASLPKNILCIQTHESVRQGCEVLSTTLDRLGIHCQVVDEINNKLPDSASLSVVFLADDEGSWNRFANNLEAGEYGNINIRVLISSFSRQQVQKRLGDILPTDLNIVELPFIDSDLVSTLSPLKSSTKRQSVNGLESKKWRTIRLADKQVLVVDDDPISVEISQQILIDLGMNVVTATTGKQAMALCEASKFDALLLDCHLPDISGYDIAETLSQQHGWTVPIIALSADETQEASEKALAAGMCFHLVKPAKADEIIHTIDTNIHAGYIEVTIPDDPSPFISSLVAFYNKYSQRRVMSDLLNIFHSPAEDNLLLTELYNDAQHIGATTLAQCLHILVKADERPDTIIAKHVATLSFELDATLRLIAHTVNKDALEVGETSNEDLDEASILSSLDTIKSALETYDAKALEYISSFAAKHSESQFAIEIHRLRQLASIYDFEKATVLINQLIDTISNEQR